MQALFGTQRGLTLQQIPVNRVRLLSSQPTWSILGCLLGHRLRPSLWQKSCRPTSKASVLTWGLYRQCRRPNLVEERVFNSGSDTWRNPRHSPTPTSSEACQSRAHESVMSQIGSQRTSPMVWIAIARWHLSVNTPRLAPDQGDGAFDLLAQISTTEFAAWEPREDVQLRTTMFSKLVPLPASVPHRRLHHTCGLFQSFDAPEKMRQGGLPFL